MGVNWGSVTGLPREGSIHFVHDANDFKTFQGFGWVGWGTTGKDRPWGPQCSSWNDRPGSQSRVGVTSLYLNFLIWKMGNVPKSCRFGKAQGMLSTPQSSYIFRTSGFTFFSFFIKVFRFFHKGLYFWHITQGPGTAVCILSTVPQLTPLMRNSFNTYHTNSWNNVWAGWDRGDDLAPHFKC